MTVGIALNTAHLNDEQAQRAVSETADATGRLVLDPVREGSDQWVDVLMA